MIDKQGYRANVGMILINKYQEVFWGGRIGQPDAWQFPQGGVDQDEEPIEAMYRELHEEVGLKRDDVRVLGETKKWLRYRLPHRFIRRHSRPLCIGQKQKWFLLELVADEDKIDFNVAGHPEFDRWCWVDYWHPVDHVIKFKRRVYLKALKEFKPIIFGR